MVTKEQLLVQATAHETKQEWHAAITLYIQAVVLDPKDVDIINSLGIMYDKVKAFDYAERCYRQVIEIDPTFYPARYNLIQLYRVQERVTDTQALIVDLYIRTSDQVQRKELAALLQELHGEPVEVCHQCRCLSPHVKAFKRHGLQTLCPYCKYEQSKTGDLFMQGVQIVVPLVLLVLSVATTFLIASPDFLRLHYLATNLLLTIIAFFAFQILHEAIHAVAVVLVGGRTQTIAFGQGDLLWKTDIGHTTVLVHKRLGLSMSMFGFPYKPRFVRLRAFFVLLAPSVVHLAICFALWQGVPYGNFASMYAIRGVIVLANLFMLFPLIPYFFQNNYISDALFMLVTLISKETPDILVGSYYVKKAYFNCEQKAYGDALQCIETGIELQTKPGADLLAIAASYALADGQLQKACTYAEQLVHHYPTNLDAQAAGFNMIAYTKMFLGELEESHHYAQKAFRLRPWSSGEMDTLGAVLVETGDIENGSRHLEESLLRHNNNQSKASTSAALAYAHWRKGDEPEAEIWLRKAEALDDSMYMVRHVREKMNLQLQS